jgi:hypothetical protein
MSSFLPPRLPGEGSRAYAVFALYALAGSDRSLAKLSQQHAESIPKLPTLKRWSATWQWQERTAAYDQQIAAQAAAAQAAIWQQRAIETAEQAWDNAQALIDRAKEMLAWPIAIERVTEEVTEDGTTITRHVTVTPARWTARDIPAYLEAAEKLRRLACELPTNRVAVDLTPDDLAKMSRQELLALRERLFP